MLKAQDLAAEVIGVELEKRVQNYWQDKLKIVHSIGEVSAVSEKKGVGERVRFDHCVSCS